MLSSVRSERLGREESFGWPKTRALMRKVRHPSTYPFPNHFGSALSFIGIIRVRAFQNKKRYKDNGSSLKLLRPCSIRASGLASQIVILFNSNA